MAKEARSDEAAAIEPEPEGPRPESEPAKDLLELVLADHDGGAPKITAPQRIEGVVVGILTGLTASGAPLVDHPHSASHTPSAARSIVELGLPDIGKELALVFEGGAPDKPIVMGKMHLPAPPAEEPAEDPARAPSHAGELAVTRDGERLELSAEREIVLRCGSASITLTRAGKVIVRGAYVLTRSSGVNRIQGGSVEIN